jgi:hypothetical protein
MLFRSWNLDKKLSNLLFAYLTKKLNTFRGISISFKIPLDNISVSIGIGSFWPRRCMAGMRIRAKCRLACFARFFWRKCEFVLVGLVAFQ